jgi:nucleotide-binding universal stress UspA family protein
MFKRILVPTDGSRLSEAAAAKAVEFAKSINAKIYGFHAVPEPPPPMDWLFTGYPDDALCPPPAYQSIPALQPPASHRFDLKSEKEFRARADELGRSYLASIEAKARRAGVACECVVEISHSPYQAVLKAAQDHRCDLIFMASHGGRGISALLLGSETQKVLAHTKIPVLVYRDHETGAQPGEFRRAVSDFESQSRWERSVHGGGA